MKDSQHASLVGSGPRCGIGELTIPAMNRVAQSCQEGNPTSAKRIDGRSSSHGHVYSGVWCESGEFRIECLYAVYNYNFIQSGRLLADAIKSFNAIVQWVSKQTKKRYPSMCTTH